MWNRILKISSYLKFSYTSDLESEIKEVKKSMYSFGISCRLKTAIKFLKQIITLGGKETFSKGKCIIICIIETILQRFLVVNPMNIDKKIFVDIVADIKLLVAFENASSCFNSSTIY